MRIEKVHIKGFRNFDDTEITVGKKVLMIGANDVGKTNFIYALRLLFDKSISEHDLELSDEDYNAYTNPQSIEITVFINEIVEDCLLSAFEGDVKDGRSVIRYTNDRNGTYSFSIGISEEMLRECTSRKYIRALNMQCVDTNRELFSFLRRERNQILQLSREKRNELETEEDEQRTQGIQGDLDRINSEINSLHFVSNALENVNQELSELSAHNEDQTIKFVAGQSDAGRMLDNLSLAYMADSNPLTIGGDGRNNQIFLATWIAKQNIQKNIDHVTFYAIEEPEAHLHPHQQRKLSEYIVGKFADQVIVTSHSPHIAARFSPENIIRLYSVNKLTYAASGGCSNTIQRVFREFGYRRNVLSAESFFADGILLVEGVSEVLFYTALAEELGLDLDRRNITILSVEGVGFKPYVAICDALEIPWALRTDNDVFAVPKSKGVMYYAGISRAVGIYEEAFGKENDLAAYWHEHKDENFWRGKKPSNKAVSLNVAVRTYLAEKGIFLSDVDLETDLSRSKLKETLKQYYGIQRVGTALVESMKRRKAENMMEFLEMNKSSLNTLSNDPILEPLRFLIKQLNERVHPQ